MRLLHTVTLKLKEFFDDLIPEYAILSHTWGYNEFLFSDVDKSNSRRRADFPKVSAFCSLAFKHGYEWVWVDTCCIDKSSSAELSESINSMYRWYKAAHMCYVYMEDVRKHDLGSSKDDGETSRRFASSRWWTRGWTLQELIAPAQVEFYDGAWQWLGTKKSLESGIAAITTVDVGVLRGEDLSSRSVGLRMSWAAQRRTSRLEDMAYCLLGLFDVNMPMLYGEGIRAFGRLQEEIMKTTEDYTLFIWPSSVADSASHNTIGLLATSPKDFCIPPVLVANGCDYGRISNMPISRANPKDLDFFTSLRKPGAVADVPPTLTARGLRMTLPVIYEKGGRILVFMHCFTSLDQLVCIRCAKVPGTLHRYGRLPKDALILLERNKVNPSSFRSADKYFQTHKLLEGLGPRLLSEGENQEEYACLYIACGDSRYDMVYSDRILFRHTAGTCMLQEWTINDMPVWVALGRSADQIPWCHLKSRDHVDLSTLCQSLAIHEDSAHSRSFLEAMDLEAEIRRRPQQWEKRFDQDKINTLYLPETLQSSSDELLLNLNKMPVYSLELKSPGMSVYEPDIFFVKAWSTDGKHKAKPGIGSLQSVASIARPRNLFG